MKTFDLTDDELARCKVAFFSLYPSSFARWDVQRLWDGPAADEHRQAWALCLKAHRPHAPVAHMLGWIDKQSPMPYVHIHADDTEGGAPD